MYVLTIDQRGSSTDVDRVPEFLDGLHRISRGFERSVGDEVQGVLNHPRDVVEVSLHALRSGLALTAERTGLFEVESNGTLIVLTQLLVR